MAQRGRKPAASLALVGKVAPIVKDARLAPPKHLLALDKQVWLEVVNDQPANAFTPTHGPLLEMYCRHISQARILSEQVLNFEPEWLATDDGLKRYDKLLGMVERETRAASSLATRLRITRQAVDQQTIARGLNNKATSARPWEMPIEHDE